jgi:hypothetical protein
MHTWHSEPLGNSCIPALQMYNISTNSINVISRSYMHRWHSKPLGNSCNTCTPNTCHLMKSTQCHYLDTLAYMTFRTFGKLMLYMHSKYMPSHRMQVLSSRISLYICFPSHIRKHMHTNTSSIKKFSKSCHTSPWYACSCSIFLDSLPIMLQPQDLFLMPRDSTFCSFTCSTYKASTQGLVQHSWFRYASASTLSMLCVHAITHATHLMTWLFINFPQYMYHINHFPIHVFSNIT